MSRDDYTQEFAGRKVWDWAPGRRAARYPDVAVRLSTLARDGSWPQRLGELLDEPGAGDITALVIGPWWDTGMSRRIARDWERDPSPAVEALVASHLRLPNLRAVLVGDISREEGPGVALRQTDLAPLLAVFPGLEELWVRGGEGLSLGRAGHPGLRRLVIEGTVFGNGVIPRSVLRELAAGDLPALEHLELSLGAGGDEAVTMEDLAPLLDGSCFPGLQWLALTHTDHSDAAAVRVAGSPLMARLKVLDLSMGNVGDAGAEALMANPAAAKLIKLDLHQNHCSDRALRRLRLWGKKTGVVVDADPGLVDWKHEDGRYDDIRE